MFGAHRAVQISVDPEWAVTDEDDNDDPTYTIVGGNSNGRFTIHPTTGIITSTLEYDVDQGAMPDTDVLVVQVNIFLGLFFTPRTPRVPLLYR